MAMLTKKGALLYFVFSLVTAGLVIFHAGAAKKEYLYGNSIDYNDFLGMLFVSLLFLSSVFFFRLVSSDSGFAGWKRFMRYFAPVACIIVFLLTFDSGGGGWVLGDGTEILMGLLIFSYIAGSLIVIITANKK